VRTLLALALLAALAAPARADDEAETRARAHLEIGRGMYRLGDYRGALKEFAAGYALAPKPGFLINIGQTYRKLGDFAHARDLYRKFLESAPADDAQRPEATAILSELEAWLRAHPQAATPEPAAETSAPAAATARAPAAATGSAPATGAAAGSATGAPAGSASATGVPAGSASVAAAPVRARDRRGLRVAGIAVGALGVAALGGGLGAALAADGTARDLTNLDRAGGTFDPAKDSLYGSERGLEIGLLTVGAAATATGVTLLVLGRRR
jgi:tetratricopeptide (TPR) repeat protein